MGVSWYLIVILICISLLITDGEYILVSFEYLESVLDSSQSFSPAVPLLSFSYSLSFLPEPEWDFCQVHPSLRAPPPGDARSGLPPSSDPKPSLLSPCEHPSPPSLSPAPHPGSSPAHLSGFQLPLCLLLLEMSSLFLEAHLSHGSEPF